MAGGRLLTDEEHAAVRAAVVAALPEDVEWGAVAIGVVQQGGMVTTTIEVRQVSVQQMLFEIAAAFLIAGLKHRPPMAEKVEVVSWGCSGRRSG